MKLGYGFPDNIGISKFKSKVRRDISEGEEQPPELSFRSRLGWIYLLLIAIFLILTIRLFHLQIIEGGKNRLIAEENRIRVKPLPAPRGIITDRKGEVLVRNIPGYRLKGENPKCLKEKCPSQFLSLSREEALQVEAKGGTDAANLEVEILREYLYPEVLAHVLGYTGEITQDELGVRRGEGYELGDQIGRAGMEKQYEEILRGKKGQEIIEVDAQEKKLDTLREIAPQAGHNLTLTIDLNLQKKAHEVLGDTKGAIVVSNPQNGEILALVSHPSFNPNLFTLKKNQPEIERLFIDEENRTLFNRAIAGLYPPGSTFKIITGAAGLETGMVNAKTQIEDTGEIVIGSYRFPNWFFIQYGKTEGYLDIIRAFARSNDIFFYKAAEWVGEVSLGEWAAKFGLGQKLGIDLEGESEGLIPTPNWKETKIGERWYLGDTYHFGIGQGYLLTTPLQVNSWTAVIANGGTLHEPYLVKNQPFGNAQGKKPIIKSQKFLKKETMALIREGMKEACSEGGTGWPLFNFKVGEREIPTACKTGTAEYGDPKGRTHAWFTVFAPAYAEATAGEPEIVVTVLVENGGEGSNTAAPMAKKILEEHFK